MLLNQLLTQLNIPVTVRTGELYDETIVEKAVMLGSEPNINITTINLGKLSELKSIKKSNLRGIFLLIRDDEIDYSCFSDAKAIMLEVTDLDLDELKGRVEDILRKDSNENDETSAFVSKMLTATTLSALLMSASNYFKTRLVVASPGGRKISAASDYDIKKNRAVKLEPTTIAYTVESHAKSITINYGKDFDNNMPYAIYDDERAWMLMSKIYYGSRYLGYLVAYTGSFLNTSRINTRLFKLLSEMVAHMLEVTSQMNKSQYNEESRYLELFLGDVLEGNVDEAQVFIVGKHELFNESSKKRLLSFPLSDYMYASKKEGYLIEKIRELFPFSIPFYYKRDVIVLVNEEKDGNRLSDTEQEFYTFLKTSGLRVFGSDMFTKMYQMSLYYEQVKRTEKLANRIHREDRVLYYDEVKFYDMAWNSCNGSETELKKYCMSVLLHILEDDKNNGTDYYALLKTYIMSNKSMTESAHKLYVHKSTVAYRLNKIKELYNLDLDNFNKVVELYNSFRLIELINL